MVARLWLLLVSLTPGHGFKPCMRTVSPTSVGVGASSLGAVAIAAWPADAFAVQGEQAPALTSTSQLAAEKLQTTLLLQWDPTDYYYLAVALLFLGVFAKDKVSDLLAKAKAIDDAKDQ